MKKALKTQAFETPIFFEPIQVSEGEFNELRSLLRHETGIHITDEKYSLVQSRLGRRLREMQMRSYSEYLLYLHSHPNEITEFINALTTNKTDFFREVEHFDFLNRQILPQSVEGPRSRPFYAWSAASSTGEEAYTMAMVLNEFKAKNNSSFQFDYRVLATDVDTAVLQAAEHGIYKKDYVERNIRPDFVKKYFSLCDDGQGQFYEVSEQLKHHMKFRHHNLFRGNLATNIQFDVIFLRNVLIYFNLETIQSVIDEMVKRLAPNGYLIIGHAESLVGISHPLRLVQTSVFRKDL